MVDLILPPRETRPHRSFTLQNGMQCVVVSGEEGRSAAAMDVGVGHAEDGRQGEAHFW